MEYRVFPVAQDIEDILERNPLDPVLVADEVGVRILDLKDGCRIAERTNRISA